MCIKNIAGIFADRVMLPNSAFSLANHGRVWTRWMMLLYYRYAVLQQDLLERDVEEATKRKRRKRPRRYHTCPWRAEERRGGGCMDITPD